MGSGFKDWAAGDVLTAADVDGYLMRQTVMTFADASARDTALSGVLDEGMVVYLEDGDSLFTYDGSDWVPVLPTGVGGQNLLYNGAIQVAQRGLSVAGITSTGYYTADRWQHTMNALGTWTQSVENDAPTGSGFRNSLKILCTTADAAPAANDFFLLQQILEGRDMQPLCKGTVSAKQVTLSFWVKSNVTGTYIVELRDEDNSRQVSASYSVVVSGTWEKKTITFPADTSGVLDNDGNGSLRVAMWLASGSNFTSGTLNTVWGSDVAANRAVGQTNLAAATSNYWQITGVQLEIGNQATAFDHLPYGVELARCQRYFYILNGGGMAAGGVRNTTSAYFAVSYPTEMRAAPTVTLLSLGASIVMPADAGYALTSIGTFSGSTRSIRVLGTIGTASLTAGYGVFLQAGTLATHGFSLSAEL